MFDPIDRSLHVTKTEAAVRQVDFAIVAAEAGAYDVAITLAGAAEGMLPSSESTLFAVSLDAYSARWPEFSRPDWIAVLNLDRDWLKHQTEILPDEREFDLDSAAFMIVRASTKIDGAHWTGRMANFKVWYMARVNERKEYKA